MPPRRLPGMIPKSYLFPVRAGSRQQQQEYGLGKRQEQTAADTWRVRT